MVFCLESSPARSFAVACVRGILVLNHSPLHQQPADRTCITSISTLYILHVLVAREGEGVEKHRPAMPAHALTHRPRGLDS